VDIQKFYSDLKTYIDTVVSNYCTYSGWIVQYEKADFNWDGTIILNVTDVKKSRETGVQKIDLEIIMSLASYDILASDTKIIMQYLHHYRGIFPSLGADTRAYVYSGPVGVRVTAPSMEFAQSRDLPHLMFDTFFFVES